MVLLTPKTQQKKEHFHVEYMSQLFHDLNDSNPDMSIPKTSNNLRLRKLELMRHQNKVQDYFPTETNQSKLLNIESSNLFNKYLEIQGVKPLPQRNDDSILIRESNDGSRTIDDQDGMKPSKLEEELFPACEVNSNLQIQEFEQKQRNIIMDLVELKLNT